MDKNKALRFFKYAVAAPAISTIIRNTRFLDGSEEEPLSVLNFAGAGDFKTIGDSQVEMLVERAALSENDRVLDVGCGIGRVSLALRRRFPNLEYSGFDIVKYGIDWAGKRLVDSKSFALYHADVANSFYNPRGKISPLGYRFPFASASQDLVFATSVFTHMLETTTLSYLREVSRCLARDGRAYITTFILDEAIGKNAAFTFKTKMGLAAIESEQEPELAVAYFLDDWRQMAAASDLVLEEFFRGNWRGDAQGKDFQDAILLKKSGGVKRTSNEKEHFDTACEQFARTFRQTPRYQGVTVEEWSDIWDEIHQAARDAGLPCPCGG